MDPDNEVPVTIFCSCGARLRGVMIETEKTWETHVKNGANHVEAGHTVWVRGKPVNADIIAMVNGQPTSKAGQMRVPEYGDPR